MLPSFFTSSLQRQLEDKVLEGLSFLCPYVFFCYLSVLLLTKTFLYGKVQVSPRIERLHNIIMVAQSGVLLSLTFILAYESAELTTSVSFPWIILNADDVEFRVKCRSFKFIMIIFLLSKLYEQVDTIILILRGKSLLMLHVWHHGTTFMATYCAMFTAAIFWFGFINSFIHILMYLYYARFNWIKPFAKYITKLQILQFCVGLFLGARSFLYPKKGIRVSFSGSGSEKEDHDVDVASCSALLIFITLSYLTLFLCFFARKYTQQRV
jgi:hypothetical protein